MIAAWTGSARLMGISIEGGTPESVLAGTPVSAKSTAAPILQSVGVNRLVSICVLANPLCSVRCFQNRLMHEQVVVASSQSHLISFDSSLTKRQTVSAGELHESRSPHRDRVDTATRRTGRTSQTTQPSPAASWRRGTIRSADVCRFNAGPCLYIQQLQDAPKLKIQCT
jgi:hypothetical protein